MFTEATQVSYGFCNTQYKVKLSASARTQNSFNFYYISYICIAVYKYPSRHNHWGHEDLYQKQSSALLTVEKNSDFYSLLLIEFSRVKFFSSTHIQNFQ